MSLFSSLGLTMVSVEDHASHHDLWPLYQVDIAGDLCLFMVKANQLC